MGLGSGNTRLPVDGLTVELSLVSDVMLALSSDSMESAELMLHQRLISGLLPEPATVERTEHSLQLKVNALHNILSDSGTFHLSLCTIKTILNHAINLQL